jgi:outer membrane protein OmpA-like peptidoglycan-associated protein
MNLFESFNEIVTDEFIEKFKSYTNDSHGDLNVTVNGVFYTLLAGMIRKTNSDMSAGMLFNQIQENAKRVNLPSNLASIFSQESVLKKIETDGAKIISQVFPAYKSPLLSLVSTYSGTSKATTSMASAIVANVIISIFKKESESGKWDKEQMVVLLRQHHEPLLDTIPEGLLEKMIPSLGLHDLMTIRPYTPKKDKNDGLIPNKNAVEESPIKKQIEYADVESDSDSSGKGWIIGLLIGLLVVAGGLYWYYTENGNLDFFAKKEIPVESLEVDSLALEDSVATQTPTAPTAATPSDFSGLKTYTLNKSEAAGKEFDFKSITFISDSTGVTSESVAIVDSIATLMKANPKLQVKITAFSGSGETPFNNKRAFAVKRLLTARGIDGIKIDAVSGGIGEDFPKIKVITK